MGYEQLPDEASPFSAVVDDLGPAAQDLLEVDSQFMEVVSAGLRVPFSLLINSVQVDRLSIHYRIHRHASSSQVICLVGAMTLSAVYGCILTDLCSCMGLGAASSPGDKYGRNSPRLQPLSRSTGPGTWHPMSIWALEVDSSIASDSVHGRSAMISKRGK